MFVEVKSCDFRTRTHNRARKVTANVQLTRAYHRAHFDTTINEFWPRFHRAIDARTVDARAVDAQPLWTTNESRCAGPKCIIINYSYAPA